MDKKILILGGHPYNIPFEDHGEVVYDVEKMNECSLVVFTGGSDVSPILYGESTGRHTHCDSKRDVRESRVYNMARRMGLPMAGICRGSQFLTVMSGGKLIQHVENHAIGGTHGIETNYKDEYEYVKVTSTHHQMMNPWPAGTDNFELLAWSEEIRSDVYLDGNDEPIRPPIVEPEAVWYPNTKCLAVQFHPEYMPQSSDGYNYYQRLLQTYVL